MKWNIPYSSFFEFLFCSVMDDIDRIKNMDSLPEEDREEFCYCDKVEYIPKEKPTLQDMYLDLFFRSKEVYIWKGSNVLFSFLCWYLTELAEKNGLRMYGRIKGKEKVINMAGFQSFMKKKVKVDRKDFERFRGGVLPKGYDIIKVIVECEIQRLFNKEITKI